AEQLDAVLDGLPRQLLEPGRQQLTPVAAEAGEQRLKLPLLGEAHRARRPAIEKVGDGEARVELALVEEIADELTVVAGGETTALLAEQGDIIRRQLDAGAGEAVQHPADEVLRVLAL